MCMVNGALETGSCPTLSVVDGPKAAPPAPLEFANHVGKIAEWSRADLCAQYFAACRYPRSGELGQRAKLCRPLIISAALAWARDWCNFARGFMLRWVCIRRGVPHNQCPVGVATQIPRGNAR